MAIPVLDPIQNSRKPGTKQVPERPHLMLAGLNQKAFLNQWGEPETQVNLNRLGKFNNLGTFFLITEPTEEAHLSVWIYKKKDSILFFTKERLISHFSFRKFKTPASTPA
jgi:hypothetical protein